MFVLPRPLEGSFGGVVVVKDDLKCFLDFHNVDYLFEGLALMFDLVLRVAEGYDVFGARVPAVKLVATDYFWRVRAGRLGR